MRAGGWGPDKSNSHYIIASLYSERLPLYKINHFCNIHTYSFAVFFKCGKFLDFRKIIRDALSYILFVSHVNKEGLISTARKKLLILPSLRLLTLVDYVSLIIDLKVGSKICGFLYPHFRKKRKPMV